MMITEIIEKVGDVIIKVGCKRIITMTMVGTWSLSQLLRIGAVLTDNMALASKVGVSLEFSYLTFMIAGSYFGFSAAKNGIGKLSK